MSESSEILPPNNNPTELSDIDKNDNTPNPFSIRIGDHTYNISENYRQYLGKAIEDFGGKIKPTIIERLINFNDKTQEEFGLPALDYLFLSHHFARKGFRELGRELGVANVTVAKIFDLCGMPKMTPEQSRKKFTLEERREIYRKGYANWTHEMYSERTSRANAAQTTEQRSEKQRRAYSNMTDEAKKQRGLKISQALTPEERYAIAVKRESNLTEEQKAKRRLNRQASRTHEDRSETAKAIWANIPAGERSERLRKSNAVLSSEQRSHRAMKGILSQTPEQLSERSRKANANMTTEKKLARLRAQMEGLRRTRCKYNGHNFDSLSEAVVGSLLEKYIYGFKLIEGQTFQVEMAHGGSIDFKIGDTIIEYHPILLFKHEKGKGDMASIDESIAYKIASQEIIESEEKSDFKKRMTNIYENEYIEKRKLLINMDPILANKELVVIHNNRELYDRVITQLGTNVPTYAVFNSEANRLYKTVRNQNRTENNLPSEQVA